MQDLGANGMTSNCRTCPSWYFCAIIDLARRMQ